MGEGGNTLHKLRRLFARALGTAEREIPPETPLRALLRGGNTARPDAPVDSFDLVELTMCFEEAADDPELSLPGTEIDLDTWKRLIESGTLRDLAEVLDRGGA